MNEMQDLRCDQFPSRLLARLRTEPGVRIVSGNLIEVACRDCRRQYRRDGADVIDVLHRWDVLGTLIETEVVAPSGSHLVPPRAAP